MSSAAAERPLRADARRNREQVVAVAEAAFLNEGSAVSLDEIARRAGVGAGTVHRHFPTKEALIEAVIARRLEALAQHAQSAAEAVDPGPAFYKLFVHIVLVGGASHAMADGLTDAGVALQEAIAAPLGELWAALARLLVRAQEASAVRDDLNVADLQALLAGAHTIERHASGGERGVWLLCEALRPRVARPRPR